MPRIRLKLPPFRIPKIRLPPPATFEPRWRTSVADLAVAATVPEAATALRDLYHRRGYQRLMVNAFCTGISTLAEQPPSPEFVVAADGWRQFLLDYLDRYWRNALRSYSRSYAMNVVDTWLDAAKIAEISNVQAARVYLRACGL